MKYYEDFPVGASDTFPGCYVVTEAEICEMGKRWDPQPFHVDADAAAESVFGGLVACSVHLFAMAVALTWRVPADEVAKAVSALGFDKMRLHAPARPDDELSLSSTVLEQRLSTSRPGLGVVRARQELHNQRDELVFSYESAFLIERRDTG